MPTNLHTHVSLLAQRLKSDLESIRLTAGFDANWNHGEKTQLSETEEAQVAEALNHGLVQLAETGIVGPENQLPSQVLWKGVGSELAHGALQRRAREKPRGYAGDDVLLRQIHEQEVCSHPLGRAFDRYFQSQDAAGAVRGRMRIAAELIQETLESVVYDTDEPIYLTVAVIGAGPAIEIELAIQRMRREDPWEPCWIRPVLFDLDEAALSTAESSLAQLCPKLPVLTVRENLFRLAKQSRRSQPLRNSGVIICLGLLDYLQDEEASALLALCWRSLAEAGTMLVGNFSTSCRARTYMEWIGNWYLNYRTAEELLDLASRAGIPAKRIRIETDPTGVNLLLRAKRF